MWRARKIEPVGGRVNNRAIAVACPDDVDRPSIRGRFYIRKRELARSPTGPAASPHYERSLIETFSAEKPDDARDVGTAQTTLALRPRGYVSRTSIRPRRRSHTRGDQARGRSAPLLRLDLGYRHAFVRAIRSHE